LNTDFVFGSEKNSEFHVSILDYCTFRVEQKVMQKCSDRQSCTVYGKTWGVYRIWCCDITTCGSKVASDIWKKAL